MENKIFAFTKDFFEKLHIDNDSIEVKKESEKVFFIQIQTDDSAIVIGPHGRNLEALQKLLSLLLNHILEERIIIHLEINDYLKSKDEKLYSFIDSKIAFVIKNGNDYRLPKYNAYERKKIHSYIAGLNSAINSESRGEGEERRLFLCKDKSKASAIHSKLSIDIDGNDI